MRKHLREIKNKWWDTEERKYMLDTWTVYCSWWELIISEYTVLFFIPLFLLIAITIVTPIVIANCCDNTLWAIIIGIIVGCVGIYSAIKLIQYILDNESNLQYKCRNEFLDSKIYKNICYDNKLKQEEQQKAQLFKRSENIINMYYTLTSHLTTEERIETFAKYLKEYEETLDK